MEQGRISAIIFDLDGTLLDSIHDIALSNNKVLQSNGLPTHLVHKYIEFIGNGARKLVQLSLPDEIAFDESKVDFFLAEYKKEYLQNIVVESKLYEGIPELLKFLNKKKIPININTNKPHEQTMMIADKLLTPFKFEKILGQYEGISKKPSPEGASLIANQLNLKSSEILFVGDSDVDVKTALAANMQLVCVSYGYSSKQEMVDAGCVNFVSTVEELKAFIEKKLIK